MAELLSHALLAFGLFTALGWWISWLDRGWVAVGTVGALLPDLNRVDLLVDDSLVRRVLGIPFDWGALHTLGGIVVLAALGAALFEEQRERQRAFALLLAGACSHLLVDAVKRWANGFNGASLFPLSWWRTPTPGLYVSADRWVLVVAVGVALAVLIVDRFHPWERAQG